MVNGRARVGVAIPGWLGRPAGKQLLAGLLVAVPTVALYWRTLMPDVGFWDTAEFQAIGPVLGIAHPTGYPAYTLLAWLASVVLQPFGNEALRANLLSAILAAAAMGIVGAIVTRITGRLSVGVATGVALAVSGEAWAIGLRADPHALHLFLAALLVLVLVIWEERVRAGRPHEVWLFAAAVIFGLSLANHGLTYLLAPGVAIFVIAVEPRILVRPRLIIACAAGLAATTLAFYLYLPIRSAMNPPLDYANAETWDGFRYLVFAEQFRGTFKPLPGIFESIRNVGTETLAELGLFAFLAVVGVFASAWRRPALMLLLGTWFVVNWFFALGYINADIGRYYLVSLLAAAIFAGMGAGAIVDGAVALWRRVRANAPELNEQEPGTTSRRGGRFKRIALEAIVAVILLSPSVASIPARYRVVDASHDRIARTWLDTVMTQLPPNAVVVSWWSYSTALWYGLYVDHLRPDVTVIDDSTIVQQHLGSVSLVVDSYLGRRPVFLIRLSYDLAQFDERYVLTPLTGVIGGDVYEVDGMRARSPVGVPAANL